MQIFLVVSGEIKNTSLSNILASNVCGWEDSSGLSYRDQAEVDVL